MARNQPTPENRLTPRQAEFVREFLVDRNATQAAIRCGYSPNAARQQGSRLLTNAAIQAAIDEVKANAVERAEISVAGVLDRIHKTILRCAQEEPVTDRTGKPTGEYTFNAAGVLKGCELLGRHLAMFTDKGEVKHSVDESITNLLTQLQGTRLKLK